MPLDFQDYEELVKRETKVYGKGKLNPLLRQAAVKATALIGTSEWDTYLTYIQAIVEDTESIKTAARKKLEDPNVVGYEDLIKCKTVLRESEAILGVLRQIVNLPHAIIHEREMVEEIKRNIPLPELPENLRL